MFLLFQGPAGARVAGRAGRSLCLEGRSHHFPSRRLGEAEGPGSAGLVAEHNPGGPRAAAWGSLLSRLEGERPAFALYLNWEVSHLSPF